MTHPAIESAQRTLEDVEVDDLRDSCDRLIASVGVLIEALEEAIEKRNKRRAAYLDPEDPHTPQYHVKGGSRS